MCDHGEGRWGTTLYTYKRIGKTIAYTFGLDTNISLKMQ